jgi:hypothetical protein
LKTADFERFLALCVFLTPRRRAATGEPAIRGSTDENKPAKTEEFQQENREFPESRTFQAIYS